MILNSVKNNSIELVRVAKLLGIYLQCNFCCEEHVKFILSLCSQRVYLLKLLRDRGLSASQLQLVCQAIIISRLVYVLPAWGGFLSADNRNRLDAYISVALLYVCLLLNSCCLMLTMFYFIKF